MTKKKHKQKQKREQEKRKKETGRKVYQILTEIILLTLSMQQRGGSKNRRGRTNSCKFPTEEILGA